MSSSNAEAVPDRPGVIPASEKLSGYIEGYYGRLLSWSDRAAIVKHLAALDMDTYLYAPKEDDRHRLHWREQYDQTWIQSFTELCALSASLNIRMLAGIAPGQDFAFAPERWQEDFDRLQAKAKALLEAGASSIVLLLDDIDPDFSERNPGAKREGVEHALLANRLGDALGQPVFLVPRVYADEIHPESPDYLADLGIELGPRHTLVYCGRHIVEPSINCKSLEQLREFVAHRVVFWDNLYANDYCPRRLFLGTWQGRDPTQSILLNPTGLPETDKLLLSLMASEMDVVDEVNRTNSGDQAERYRRVLANHEVPGCFEHLRSWFDLPPFEFPSAVTLPPVSSEQFDALETLLWKWKSPLSREWYASLLGLKQDLLLLNGNLPVDRVHKTQTPVVSSVILGEMEG